MKVVAFGTFDPLHKGHEEFLKQAKKLGDYLVVVVSQKDKINLEKSRAPRGSDKDRLQGVNDLEIADEVILGESGDKYEILEQINPDIIALGYDQKIPEPLKNKVKQYKIITLKPFKSGIYKSSIIKNS
ncbi:MAG: adenylyltransferase/cytidyltransferase family protein [bacterium]